MALIRGSNGLCPCPICLIPLEKLSDLETAYPLRTAQDSEAAYNEAKRSQRRGDAESLMKNVGLRFVKVIMFYLYLYTYQLSLHY